MSKRSREQYAQRTEAPAAPISEAPQDPCVYPQDDQAAEHADASLDLAEQIAAMLKEDGYEYVGTRGEVISRYESQTITVEAAVILALARRVRKCFR